MTREKGKHLSKENREAIESGVRNGDSARAIARRIDVSPSTVTREVKAHRTVREKRASQADRASAKCARYASCQASGTACAECSTRFTNCKRCRTRRCWLSCPDFELRMCEETEKWPYVCPGGCPKRGWCALPKCSYDAGDAHGAYKETLSSSRSGICCTQEELDAMNAIVVPLAKQGQSFEAIWAEHAGELPVCVRSAYKYQELNAVGLTSLDMPRKARLLPRKRPEAVGAGRERVDRTGRTYDDFNRLPVGDKARVVQGDSVEGYDWNTSDILSLHLVAHTFQIYLKKAAKSSPAPVVAWLDAIERELGSPEAFEEVFGIMLLDRGAEFDDWAGMERSCLVEGARRCRVFYCDAQNSNQKSPAERNHEQLRRILPKKRSDFDKLSVWDVAVCCSHVNSYPLARKSGAFRPIEAAAALIPRRLLDALGIERVPADEVTLKPYLMAHAVEQ
ncbi:MAG: helix-turn-helix domain-containing protein [Eggerthellaceae bacterium]|nr:helix-turn-helix domain-containing protein [Eggerthellaceae bacterium]